MRGEGEGDGYNITVNRNRMELQLGNFMEFAEFFIHARSSTSNYSSICSIKSSILHGNIAAQFFMNYKRK